MCLELLWYWQAENPTIGYRAAVHQKERNLYIVFKSVLILNHINMMPGSIARCHAVFLCRETNESYSFRKNN